MIAVYCFYPGDQDLALKNAQWITELGGCKGHEAVCCYDPRCPKEMVEAIGLELLKSFDKLYRLPAKAEMDGWPEGANYFFRTCVAWLQTHPEWSHFLWLEPDAIFLVPGVVDKLVAEHNRGGRPFMGDRVQVTVEGKEIPVHMSGVGIYPNPLHAYAGEAYRAHDVAWDMAGKDQIVPRAHFTKLIQHYWKHGTFSVEQLSNIRPEAVIFHSSKDGSLIDLLRKNRRGESVGHQSASSIATQADSPSPLPPGIRKLPGDIWVLEDDTVISEQVAANGRLDFDTLIPHVLQHIERGDTVVDVGAFIGDHTVAYSNAVGETGRVFAYEPNPVAFECLKHNTKSLGNVFGFQFALGKEVSTGRLVRQYSPASAYIGIDTENIYMAPITIRAMDENLTLYGQVDLIKIDVEGYELNVLEGAEQIINQFHPKLVIEINETALARQNVNSGYIFDWLLKHEYSHSILYRHGDDSPFYDILCLPETRPSETTQIEAPSSTAPVAVPQSLTGQLKGHIDVLKSFAATDPQAKALVHLLLVKAGLREPKKKKK